MAWRECVNHYFLWTRMLHWLTDCQRRRQLIILLASLLPSWCTLSVTNQTERKKKKRKTGKCSLHLFPCELCCVGGDKVTPLFRTSKSQCIHMEIIFFNWTLSIPFSRERESIKLGLIMMMFTVVDAMEVVWFGWCVLFAAIFMDKSSCILLLLRHCGLLLWFLSRSGTGWHSQQEQAKANHNSQSLRTLASAQQARILIGFFFFFFLPVSFLSCSDCCVCTQHLNICHLSTTNLLRTLSEIRAHVSVHRRM